MKDGSRSGPAENKVYGDTLERHSREDKQSSSIWTGKMQRQVDEFNIDIEATLNEHLRTPYTQTIPGEVRKFDLAFKLSPDEWSKLEKYASNENITLKDYLQKYFDMALLTALREGHIYDSFKSDT